MKSLYVFLFKSDYCESADCSDPSYIYSIGPKNDIQHYPFSMGTLFEFHSQPIPELDAGSTNQQYHAFDIYYTEGNNLPIGCNYVQTSIKFFCDLHAGRGELKLLQSDSCNVQFTWNSSYACPTCDIEKDVITEVGACIDGQRILTSRFARPCNDIEVTTIAYDTQACEILTVNKFTGLAIVAGVIILLLGGIGLAILFFRQKRELEVKYKQLKTDNNLADSDGDEGLAQLQINTREKEMKDDVEVALDANDDEDELPVQPEISDDDSED